MIQVTDKTVVTKTGCDSSMVGVVREVLVMVVGVLMCWCNA